jgi:hypothetical protein
MKIIFFKLVIVISFLSGAIFGIDKLQKPFNSIVKSELKINNTRMADLQLFQSSIPNDDETDVPDTIDDDDDIFDNLTKIVFFSCGTILLFSMLRNVYFRSNSLISQTPSSLKRVYSQSYLQTFRI